MLCEGRSNIPPLARVRPERWTFPVGGLSLPRQAVIDKDIRLAISRIDGVGDFPICAPQAAGLNQASQLRRREFVAGRACARAAMQAAGVRPMPVAIAPDRSPVWPSGIVGSISHSPILAMAAIAPATSGIRSIGLDIEPATPLAADLIDEICGRKERLWLDNQPAESAGLLAKAIFCIKEAVYKCQYPLSRTLFGFDVIDVEIDLSSARFAAHFLDYIPPFRPDDSLSGVFWLTQGHIVALSALR